MSTLELHWTAVCLNTTRFDSSGNIHDRAGYLVQWHTAASTLYIIFPNRPEIDVRVEREVFEVYFQDPSIEAATAVIALRMLHARHLPWADKTDFNPVFDDANQITFRVESTDMAIYESLTQWLRRNVNNGAAKSLTIDEAQLMIDDVTEESAAVVPVSTQQNSEGSEVESPKILSSPYGNLDSTDIKRLLDDNWANDNIIDFALKWIAAESRIQHPDINFHVLTTFFFTKLRDSGVSSMSKWGQKGQFDPFNYETILIPVNDGQLHWFLVIVDYPYRALKKKNGNDDGKSTIDELDQSGRMFNTIMRYLGSKAAERTDETFDQDNWNHLNVPVPRQLNHSDCGYYLLHFAKVFLSAPEVFRGIILSKKKHINKWGAPQQMRNKLREFVEGQIGLADE